MSTTRLVTVAAMPAPVTNSPDSTIRKLATDTSWFAKWPANVSEIMNRLDRVEKNMAESLHKKSINLGRIDKDMPLPPILSAKNRVDELRTERNQYVQSIEAKYGLMQVKCDGKEDDKEIITPDSTHFHHQRLVAALPCYKQFITKSYPNSFVLFKRTDNDDYYTGTKNAEVSLADGTYAFVIVGLLYRIGSKIYLAQELLLGPPNVSTVHAELASFAPCVIAAGEFKFTRGQLERTNEKSGTFKMSIDDVKLALSFYSRQFSDVFLSYEEKEKVPTPLVSIASVTSAPVASSAPATPAVSPLGLFAVDSTVTAGRITPPKTPSSTGCGCVML